jgi:hemolysin activation/secretion protein
LAIAPIPASTQPGVIGNIISESLPAPSTTSVKPEVPQPEEAKVPYNAEAAKIRFKLTKIVLTGNTIYTTEQISELYKDKLNTEMSVLDFQKIVQSITNYYRNNGYILSRAIIPPQHVKNGVIEVQVIEGFIDVIKIQGDARRSNGVLEKYGKNITSSRPLHLSVLERYLRLANEVPGVQVKSVLEPSKKTPAAATLVFVVTEQRVGGYISYDNYGTRYLGPHEATINATLRSGLMSGDAFGVTFLDTTRPKELRFLDMYYQLPVGSDGMSLVFDGNKSLTDSGYVLQPFDVIGNAVNYYVNLQYPAIRTIDKSLTLDGGLIYYHGIVTSLAQLLYDDNVRALRLGGNYLFSDSYKGSNAIYFHLEQGLPVFGATSNPQSFFTSRYGATGTFTKIMLQYSRDQALYDRFSAFFQFNSQYAFNPLLSFEQFTWGGSLMGRGYDPAELIGDTGIGASAELRMNIYPGLRFLQDIQLYGYYEIGKVWNLRDLEVLFNSYTELSAASAGGGLRFNFNKYVSGNFMVTQPLTKQVAALELIGNGRDPRLFFGVSASV